MKKCSTSLPIKEMKINVILRPQSEWQSSNKQTIAYVGEDVEKRDSYLMLVGMYISATTVEITMEISLEKKIELPYDPTVYSWAYISRNMSNMYSVETPACPCLQ
jgi:hypothetical protein